MSAWRLGLVLQASASGPRGEARLGHHLVVVKVPVDRETVSPDPLGLPGCSAPGPPLDHTGCVALGPHQLWGLLVLLHWLCGKKWTRGSGSGQGCSSDRTASVAVPREVWLPVAAPREVWLPVAAPREVWLPVAVPREVWLPGTLGCGRRSVSTVPVKEAGVQPV